MFGKEMDVYEMEAWIQLCSQADFMQYKIKSLDMLSKLSKEQFTALRLPVIIPPLLLLLG